MANSNTTYPSVVEFGNFPHLIPLGNFNIAISKCDIACPPPTYLNVVVSNNLLVESLMCTRNQKDNA